MYWKSIRGTKPAREVKLFPGNELIISAPVSLEDFWPSIYFQEKEISV